MNVNYWLFIYFLCGTALYAVPSYERPPSDWREAAATLRHLHQNHETELRMLEEKIENQEQIIESFQREYNSFYKSLDEGVKDKVSSLGQKIASLEIHLDLFSQELSLFKKHLEKQNVAINALQDKLIAQEGILTNQNGNVSHLQAALKSLTEALQEPAASTVAEETKYCVQGGDNLGKIALKFGVTVKELKEANQLTSDKILPQQTLIIPPKKS